MGKESNCPFCKELAKAKSDADYYRRSERCTERYTVALVSESYWDGNFTGRLTHYGQALNFCPTCGKALPDVNSDKEDKTPIVDKNVKCRDG